MERSLVLVKPDAMQRGLAGEVIKRIEQRGFRIVGMKLMQISRSLAEQHYGEHKGKPFFDGLVEYIVSSPVVAVVFEGTDVCKAIRGSVGSTNPAEAAPGSIRADFGAERGRNLVHASDSPESGQREVGLFFNADELIDWKRDTDRWIFE
jgi:nucleoside-diphosphate kinase